MKKALVVSLVSMVLTQVSHAQGRICLDTYNASPYPQITYGNAGYGSPGPVGTPINSTFTVGLYYAVGIVSVTPDPNGWGVPEQLGPLTLATGPGSTTTMIGDTGWFASVTDYAIPVASGTPVTLMVVVYNGASYGSSILRSHSAAFTLMPAQGVDAAPRVGIAMLPFTVSYIPEPSTFALAGLGLAGLLIFRRRK